MPQTSVIVDGIKDRQLSQVLDAIGVRLETNIVNTGAVLTTPILRGTVLQAQAAATAKTVSVTLTAAEILAGIITVNQGAAGASALTLPLGTDMDLGIATAAVNDSFNFYVINISVVAAEDATVTTNTGWTLVGGMVVESRDTDRSNSSGYFCARRTAAGLWTLYRLA